MEQDRLKMPHCSPHQLTCSRLLNHRAAYRRLEHPLAVTLLPAHDEPTATLDDLVICILCDQKAHDRPSRINDQRLIRINPLSQFAGFITLSPTSISHLFADDEIACFLHARRCWVGLSCPCERFESEHCCVRKADAPATKPGPVRPL